MAEDHFEDDYDYIVLGTGLTQCILASVLACHGKRVLHMDKNDYYGDECASLSLDQLFLKFKKVAKAPAELGRNRDYNIDMVPKMPMSNGNIMKAIVHTGTVRYLEFQKCKGAYVLKKGKLYKIPSSDKETLTTGLMGIFSKKKLRDLILFIMKINPDDPKTYPEVNVRQQTMGAVYKHFGLDLEACEFIGHGMALYHNDEYINKPALPTLLRIKLFLESIARYGDSPYVYPKYGIGELCQAFARLSAVFGAIYILAHPVDEILYNAEGNVSGLRSGGEKPRATHIVGDPTYFPNLVKPAGQIVRAIVILSHPIKNTDDADSGMIIIPQQQVGRKSDIYISFLSSLHHVCPAGKFLAFLSTTVETKTPEKELDAALALLQPVDPNLVFLRVSDVFAPVKSGSKNIHIANSIDATSDFESIMDDVFRLYKEITGEELDLAKEAEAQDKTMKAAGVIQQDLQSSSTVNANAKTGAKSASAPAPVSEGASSASASAPSSSASPESAAELAALLTKEKLTAEEEARLAELSAAASEVKE